MKTSNEMEKLISSNDQYTLGQVRAVLEDQKIPYIEKDQGSGGYMRIIAGKSFYPRHIYVSRKDISRAREAIDFLEGHRS